MNKLAYFRIGSNMFDKPNAIYPRDYEDGGYHQSVYFEKEEFHKITEAAREFDFDTVVLDLAEGIVYDSHPELAIEGSMPKSEFKEELFRLRGLGFKVLPMIDFSPAKNAWMGKYADLVGSKIYYEVCDDLLYEVIDLFDNPEFIHLGHETESFEDQKRNPIIATRHHTKRLEDVNRLFDICKSKGVRPWIWCSPEIIESYGGDELFLKGIGKDVVLSPLTYKLILPHHIRENRPAPSVVVTKKLADWGYDIIPMASIWWRDKSPDQTMWYYKNYVDTSNFLGAMCYSNVFTVERRHYWMLNNMHRFITAFNTYFK